MAIHEVRGHGLPRSARNDESGLAMTALVSFREECNDLGGSHAADGDMAIHAGPTPWLVLEVK